MSILTGPKLKFSHGLKMYVIFARSDKMRVTVPMAVKNRFLITVTALIRFPGTPLYMCVCRRS